MSGAPHKSRYVPKHPEKYMGDPTQIFCRSSWERKFCRYCDDTPGVVRWQSEEFSIPYVKPTDNQVHRYFPDFYIEVKKAGGGVKKFVIEIKPKKHSMMPTPRKKTQKYITEVVTVAINQAKWAAAEEYCKKRGWTFLVLTEDHLFGK